VAVLRVTQVQFYVLQMVQDLRVTQSSSFTHNTCW